MRSRNSELARGGTQSSIERHENEKSNSETMDLLRRILFRQEREKLAELSESVELLKTQLTVPEVLADNLEPYIGRILARRFAESPEDMARLLSPIVAASIKYQIREARDDVIEILYPIMAEAINRQIEESKGEVGGEGLILRTADGGETWKREKIGGSKLLGISAVKLLLGGWRMGNSHSTKSRIVRGLFVVRAT